MTAPSPDTIRRRLRDAGYEPIPAGWLPKRDAERVARLIEANRARIDEIAAEPPLPRGRPPKSE